MKNKKVLLISMITAALLAVVTIGVTIATLADNTLTLTNTFEPGSVTTEIDEPDPDDGEVKKCRVKNTGKLDCLVRARVTISPAEAAKVIKLNIRSTDWEWSSWNNGDGYVYYKAVLRDKSDPNPYTSYMFEGIALDEKADLKSLGVETFDIALY